MPRYRFSPDLEYLYVKNPDGSVSAMPTKYLTEEDKDFIYKEIAKEQYA